ncbi:hypothetical protein VPH49_25395 [Pseudomonas luteola]|uniref:hypothetical protein n=2 Tax=Pseudomonas TaxID=286 RepID=UPI003A8ACE13
MIDWDKHHRDDGFYTCQITRDARNVYLDGVLQENWLCAYPESGTVGIAAGVDDKGRVIKEKRAGKVAIEYVGL